MSELFYHANPRFMEGTYSGKTSLLVRHTLGSDPATFAEKFSEGTVERSLAEEPQPSPDVEICLSGLLGGDELGVRVKPGHHIPSGAIICPVYGKLFEPSLLLCLTSHRMESKQDCDQHFTLSIPCSSGGFLSLLSAGNALARCINAGHNGKENVVLGVVRLPRLVTTGVEPFCLAYFATRDIAGGVYLSPLATNLLFVQKRNCLHHMCFSRTTEVPPMFLAAVAVVACWFFISRCQWESRHSCHSHHRRRFRCQQCWLASPCHSHHRRRFRCQQWLAASPCHSHHRRFRRCQQRLASPCQQQPQQVESTSFNHWLILSYCHRTCRRTRLRHPQITSHY